MLADRKLYSLYSKREYILAVYKTKNFSKAAKLLHISQPSLSAAVKTAEDDIGAPIFNRKTRPISLTPFGIDCIKAIRDADQILSELGDKFNAMKSLEIGNLTISASNLNLPFLVSQKIAKYKQLYPNIKVNVTEDTTFQLGERMDRGDTNIIISNREFDINKYKKIKIYEEYLIAITCPELITDHQLLESSLLKTDNQNIEISSRGMNLNKFADFPFILLNEENELRKTVNQMFADCFITPNISMIVERSSIALNFVCLGLGVSIISNHLFNAFPCKTNLLAFKIKHPAAKRNGYLYIKRNEYITHAMQKFLDLFE